MKFEIKHRWSGGVIFTAEIEATEETPISVKLGLAIKKAAESGASLNGASLDGASLDGASLDGASLNRASLDGASLDGASLDGASLNRASLDGASLNYASLNGASLDGASLNYASLNYASLNGASLNYASLDGASLDGASLDGTSLDGASLNRASLDGASLDGASLNYASLNYASLNGASLDGAKGIVAEHSTPLLMLLDQPGKIRAYKLINADGYGPIRGGLKYEIGESVAVENANTDLTEHCGAGINVATLDWCLREWRPEYRILIVEFEAKDIAAIPTATDGKFRLHRCDVVAEKIIDPVALGLIKAPEEEAA